MASLSFPGVQPKFKWICNNYLLPGECQRETHALAQWNMIGYALLDNEPIAKMFYLAPGNIQNSKQVFYNSSL